jgi:hypothetical protein
MKEDEDIETMFSKFQVLVSGMQVLDKSYSTKRIMITRFIEVYKSSGDSRLQPFRKLKI